MLDLTIRLVASLAIVVGLLLLLARVVGRRFAGRPGAAVQVLHRQPLSRTSAVAVVSVGSRVLVLGTTDQQVQLLAELDPGELETAQLELVDGELAEDDDLVLELPQQLAVREVALAPATAAPGVRRAPRPGARRAETRRSGSHRAGGERAARPVPQADGGTHGGTHGGAHGGALAGSLLSTDTWRQALAAATGKAS